MSVEAIRWAWGQDLRSPAEVAVILALADRINSGHPRPVCWCSVADIAARARLGVRQTKRVLKALRDRGLFEVRPFGRRDSQGGRGANAYLLGLPDPAAGTLGTPVTPNPPETGGGLGTSATGLSDICDRVRGHGRHPEPNRTVLNQTLPPNPLPENHASQSTNPPRTEHAPDPTEATMTQAPRNRPQAPEGVDPEAWGNFERYRREKNRGKPMPPSTRDANAAKLRPLTPEQQRATVALSIERGWTGLFPEKINPRGTQDEARGRAGRESAAERRRRVNAETLEHARRAADSAGMG